MSKGKSKQIQAAKQAAKKATAAKAKRKKWSKGRVTEKVNNKYWFDKKLIAQVEKSVPRMNVITLYKVQNDLKITQSLAKQAIRHLAAKGLIKPVVNHSKMMIYTPNVEAKKEEVKITSNK